MQQLQMVALLSPIPADLGPDARFFELQNCVLSPHTTVRTRHKRGDLIAEIRSLLGLRQELVTLY